MTSKRGTRLAPRRRPGRRRWRGQAMVEFAMVSPLLFAVLFGAIDGGFFMYAKSSVDRAGTVGMNSIAAAGVDPAADTGAIAAMRAAGLGSGALVRVSEIDVDEMTYTGSAYQTVSNCGSGSALCESAYNLDGSSQSTAWPPTARSIRAATASYIRLTVKYQYKFFAGPTQFSLTSAHIFREEPKSL